MQKVFTKFANIKKMQYLCGDDVTGNERYGDVRNGHDMVTRMSAKRVLNES